MEMSKRHQSELEECQSRTHQMKLLEREHAEEKKVSGTKLVFPERHQNNPGDLLE